MKTETKNSLLIINQYASTPKYSSGAGERFYYLAPYFNAAGYKVSVVSGSYNHLFIRSPKTDQLFTEEEIPGGIFYWLRLKNYRGENFIGRLYSWFEFLYKLFFFKLEEPPHIVIVSSMSLFPIIYGYYLKMRYSSKLILEVRDIWPLTPMELGGYSKNHPFIALMRQIEKFAYKKSDTLVSVLPGFGNHVKEVIKIYKEVTWIPNGISATLQKEQDTSGELNLLDSAYFNVVYTGAIGIANALEYLIEAAGILNAHPHIRISIIGEGPEKNALEAKVKSNSLTNIRFLPKIEKNLVVHILNQSDVCLISWRNKRIYTFGVSANKYNDYMLARKPILSASAILSDPVVVANCGLQVEPENAEAMAKGILQLYHKSDIERDKLGENGKQYVLKHKTYEVLSLKYLTLFDQLINKSISPR